MASSVWEDDIDDPETAYAQHISVLQSDLDLANKLQLEEALLASIEGQAVERHGYDGGGSPRIQVGNDLGLNVENRFGYDTHVDRSHGQNGSGVREPCSESSMEQSIQAKHEKERSTHHHPQVVGSSTSHATAGASSSNVPSKEDSLEIKPSISGCKVYVTAANPSGRGREASGVSEEDRAHLAIGVVVVDHQGRIVLELYQPVEAGVGKAAADYMAFIAGLQAVNAKGISCVEAYTDSVPCYNQVSRKWKLRSCRLQELWSQVMYYMEKFEEINMHLIPHRQNKHAVRIARQQGGKRAGTEIVEFCPICLEMKRPVEMLLVSECTHMFCISCMVQHAEVKVQAGEVPVKCPEYGCAKTLSLNQCQAILSQKWYDGLVNRLGEASMPESERVYCPFSDCSALMSRTGIEMSQQERPSRSSSKAAKCVECERAFCVDCRVPWHSSMSCEEYVRLPGSLQDAQDANLYQLARHEKWQRCKKCRRMIELVEGCFHMTCRCGYEFCYACSAPWENKQQTCQCEFWDEGYLLDEPMSDLEDLDYATEGDFEDDDIEDEDDVEDEPPYREPPRHQDDVVDVPGPPFYCRYKTRICRYWQADRFCNYGSGCHFAHGVHELRP